MDISKTAPGRSFNEDVRLFSHRCSFSTGRTGGHRWRTILRESRERLTLHLVNLTGKQRHVERRQTRAGAGDGISAAIRLDRPVRGIYRAPGR